MEYICLGPLCWAFHLDLSLRVRPWEDPFSIGSWWAQWAWLIYGTVSGISLDLMSKGLVLDPNWVNCGFGSVLQAGVQQQHL